MLLLFLLFFAVAAAAFSPPPANKPPRAPLLLRALRIREADGTEQTLEDGSVNLGGCVTVTADARRSWCEAAKPGAKIKLGDKPASLMPSVKYFIDSTATIEVDGMSYELESDAPPPAVDPALKAAMDAFKASIDR